MGAVVWEVTSPLPLVVNTGIALDEPIDPGPLLTVANVVTNDPAEVVTSPVSAGCCAAWSVPESNVVGTTPLVNVPTEVSEEADIVSKPIQLDFYNPQSPLSRF